MTISMNSDKIPSDKSTVKVSKLLVFPDFSKSVGQIDEKLQGGRKKSSSNNNADVKQKVYHKGITSDTSAKCSSNFDNPPSTKFKSKTRRLRGEGSGHIYYRTVTRNGKEYQQAYYQWREDGKQKTFYIPKKLLHHIEDAEFQKSPVTEILEILQGGLNKCSSKKFDTFSSGEVRCISKSPKGYRSAYDKTIPECSSKISSPPSKRKKRSSGYGGGYVEYREVLRNHKTYGQYWYHYEFWKEGDVVTKKSKYIPKRLVAKVERMNDKKVAVRRILEVLGVKD